jgi:hypothetical protein
VRHKEITLEDREDSITLGGSGKGGTKLRLILRTVILKPK